MVSITGLKASAVNRKRASEWVNRYCNSSAVWAVLRGTNTPPVRAMANTVQRNSGQFGSRRATFCPGRRDSDTNDRATRSTSLANSA